MALVWRGAVRSAQVSSGMVRFDEPRSGLARCGVIRYWTAKVGSGRVRRGMLITYRVVIYFGLPLGSK